VCCSVLQCVAVRERVLQRVDVCCNIDPPKLWSVLYCSFTTHCNIYASILQHAATHLSLCCNNLQHIYLKLKAPCMIFGRLWFVSLCVLWCIQFLSKRAGVSHRADCGTYACPCVMKCVNSPVRCVPWKVFMFLCVCHGMCLCSCSYVLFVDVQAGKVFTFLCVCHGMCLCSCSYVLFVDVQAGCIEQTAVYMLVRVSWNAFMFLGVCHIECVYVCHIECVLCVI